MLVLAFPAVRAITRRDRPVDDDDGDVRAILPEALEPEAVLARAS
ncbi:MAG TPA: hypothetical protein VMQ65_00660 [Candidatus Limnocylindria bacterium]|nr:hypothetical protein [Candidatus Limnocylindria bacterium]